ncbi:MAG: dienelactone hydrolase family protein [Bradymonadaceae bacterium]|nr:dienelactone hydrolase family protein [Lujinxingiaceae bacterium]
MKPSTHRFSTTIVAALVACLLVACASAPSNEQPMDAYVDAMAHEHADEAPAATPAAKQAMACAAVSSEVVYGSQGTAFSGYEARPREGAPKAGIVMIHEWWGLNDNVRAMADTLAAQGYLVLAVNLYDTEAATDAEAAKALMQAAMARRDHVQAVRRHEKLTP